MMESLGLPVLARRVLFLIGQGVLFQRCRSRMTPQLRRRARIPHISTRLLPARLRNMIGCLRELKPATVGASLRVFRRHGMAK